LNVEEDEAGKLRAFRERFGRGWDAETTGSQQVCQSKGESEIKEEKRN
jgi:hypothetical protein